MRATIELHPVYSEVPQSGSSRPLPQTDQERIILLPNEQSHSLGTSMQRESCEKKSYYLSFSDDSIISRLRSPVIQRPFSPKKGIPLSWHAPTVDGAVAATSP